MTLVGTINRNAYRQLNGNSITSLTKEKLKGLPNLKRLYVVPTSRSCLSNSWVWYEILESCRFVNHNDIESIQTDVFENNPKLSKLEMEFNKLTSLPADFLKANVKNALTNM